MVHPHDGILLAIKNNEPLLSATAWVTRTNAILSERNLIQISTNYDSTHRKYQSRKKELSVLEVRAVVSFVRDSDWKGEQE